MKDMKAFAVAAGVILAAMVQPAVAGPAKTGKSVAFASVDTGTGMLATFGGKGTTSATSSAGLGPGCALVNFVGRYPRTITPNQIVLEATAQTGDFGVASAQAGTVSPTEIDIQVCSWVSNTLSGSPEQVFVNVFIGN